MQEDIVESVTHKKAFLKGIKRFERDLDKWFETRRGPRPDRDDYVLRYEGPGGREYDWEALKNMQEAALIRRQKNELQPPPLYNLPSFQTWLANQLNQTKVFADFVLMRQRDKPLSESLAAVSRHAKDGCTGSMTDLLPHQVVVCAMAKLRAEDKISSPGLLAMHSTGAGKTVEGLCGLLAFWNKRIPNTSDGFYGLFSVSTQGNQSSNSIEKLAGLALTFFGDRFLFQNTVPGLPEFPFKRGVTLEQAMVCIHNRIKIGLRSVAASDHAFKELMKLNRNDLYTYTKLSNDLKKGLFKAGDDLLRHSLIVIDEVQFLLHPPPLEISRQREYHFLRQALTERRARKTTWVLGLTATPGSTTGEVCEILNAVAGAPDFVTPDNLAVAARGLVSYAQVQGDLHHFPRLQLAPQCVKLKPGHAYAQEYLKLATEHKRFHDSIREVSEDLLIEIEEKEQAREESYARAVDKYRKQLANWKATGKGKQPKEPNPPQPRKETGEANWKFDKRGKQKYYRKLRDASNIIIIKGKDEEDLALREAALRDEGVFTFRAQDGTCRQRQKCMVVACGPKLMKLVDNIRKLSGKHYVYTSNTQTMLVVAALLETQLHMHNLPVNCEGKACNTQRLEHGRKYFIMLRGGGSTKTLYRGEDSVKMDKWKVTTQEKPRRAVSIQTFDSLDNAAGNQVKVVLADGEFYKGVDLKGLRYIHMLEPMVDFGELVQLAGRGPRFCSHTGLPVKDWNVKLMSYRQSIEGIEGSDLDADTFVFEQSIGRFQGEFGDTENKLRKASIDYKLFDDNLHQNIEDANQVLMSASCSLPVRKRAATRQRLLPLRKVLTPSERKAELRMKAERQKAVLKAKLQYR